MTIVFKEEQITVSEKIQTIRKCVPLEERKQFF